MLNRRKFLNSGLLVAGIPLLGNAKGVEQPELYKDNKSSDFYYPTNVLTQTHETYFISHRGVHLTQRVAAENTLLSMRLAKRVGFQCVEFDVRFTKDGKAVIIHDETINRTLRTLNGNKLKQPVYVKDLSFDEIRTKYVCYTENPKAREIVPSFEEYLNACNKYKIIPFIEIKEADISKEKYDDLINTLDAFMGRKNYIITSNNRVNDKIREFGYHNIVTMGILYQTTFEHLQSLKNIIMAISCSKFNNTEFRAHVMKARQQEIFTESHTDALDKYNLLRNNGINFISTDALMPDYGHAGEIVAQYDIDDEEIEELKTDGIFSTAGLELTSGNTLSMELNAYKNFFLYGVTFEMEFSGKVKIAIKNKEYELSSAIRDYYRYPYLLHKEPFVFKILASDHTTITSLKITVSKF